MKDIRANVEDDFHARLKSAIATLQKKEQRKIKIRDIIIDACWKVIKKAEKLEKGN